MKCAVIAFPGTSGEQETRKALEMQGISVEYVRHSETSLAGFDLIVLPNGFSYGDYFRPGAVAAMANIVPAIKAAAEAGVLVLGIGNGFQILTEMGLLPGGFLQNETGKFFCGHADVIVQNSETAFTNAYTAGQTISLPQAHGYGKYWADEDTLNTLETQGRIVFTYAENGQIAGIVNERGNVLGIMPQAQRAVEALLGSEDGTQLFASISKAGRVAS